MSYKDNLEIDIFDLFKYIAKRWKVLCICAILGAIILGILGYFGSTVTIKKETGEKYSEEELSQFESLREELSAQDIAIIDASADQYLGYARDYADLMKYGDTSILMKIDPHKVPKLIASYAIDDHAVLFGTDKSLSSTADGFILMSEVDSIANAYLNELKKDEIIEEIKSTVELDVDNNIISELISVETSGSSGMTVSVIASDRDMCETIMAVLQKHMDETTAKIQKAYDYSISPIDVYFLLDSDNTIDTAQKDYNTYSYNLRVDMNYLMASMTADQKPYYSALMGLINNKVLINPSYEDVDSTSGVRELLADYIDKETKVETETIRKLSVKYVVLGLFLGVMVSALWIAVCYVVSGKLHTADDLRDAFRVSVIDEVSTKGNEANKLDIAVSGIGIAASKIKAERICVIGVARDSMTSEIREDLAKLVSENSEIKSVELCKDVLNSPADMKSLAEADVAVLVERNGSSKYENIAREIELCNKYEVKILGAVFVY